MSRKNINFDVNAIEKPDKHVLRTMWRFYHHGYANPNATYKDARMTAELIETAREKVAKALGCDADEIFFTSCSSESISWVAKNFKLEAHPKSHHSTIEASKNQPRKTPALYAIPLMVSETGECLENEYEMDNKYLFVDLTQAIGKIKIDLHSKKNIICACASAQKFGGIQGCGILYIQKKCQPYFKPLIYGSQENGFRGGTENVPAIICCGIAIEEACKGMKMYMNNRKIKDTIEYLYSECEKFVKTRHIKFTNVINITFNHLAATAAVQIFDKLGFNISAGSACNSESERPSEAYLASGYTEDEAMRTIRISVGKNNTIREAKKFIKALKKIVALYDEED